MTATLIEDTGVLSVDELMRLDGEAFGDYVFDNLGNGPAWPPLLQPQTVDRTKAALQDLKDDLDETVEEKREELSPDDFRRWQRRVEHAQRSLIGRRLSAVKGARRWVDSQEKSTERRALLTVLGRLAEEIHVHRLAAVAASLDPEIHDKALWAVLAGLTIQHNGESVPLDEALGRGLIGGAR